MRSTEEWLRGIGKGSFGALLCLLCAAALGLLSGAVPAREVRPAYAERILTDADRIPGQWLRAYRAAEDAELFAFSRSFTEHTDRLEESFSIPVSDGLKERLFREGEYVFDRSLLQEIKANCGALTYSYSHRNGTMRFSDVRYYEGKRILYAWENGLTDGMLTAREKETLNAALSIVRGVPSGGTEPEREKAVHDALCRRITYFTDDVAHNDNDCAIGALLNGKADCDGYADAFYLCAGLAGLSVRYQHGDGLQTEEDAKDRPPEQEGTHLWNLIRINGKWVMTDLTWNDQDSGRDGITYLFFNIGAEEASYSYTWDPRAIAERISPAAGNEVLDASTGRTFAGNWDEVYRELRRSAEARSARIRLSCPASMNVKDDPDRLGRLVLSAGIEDYEWSLSRTGAEIYAIRYREPFAFCDSDADVLDRIEAFANSGATSFSLFFSPEYAPGLFAEERKELGRILSRTRLKDTRHSYNESSSYIVVSDAAWYGRGQVGICGSDRDAIEFIDACAEKGTREFRLCFTPSYGNGLFAEERKPIKRLLLRTRLLDTQYVYSETSSYITIEDAAWFGPGGVGYCANEREIVAFTNACAEKGIREFRLSFTPAYGPKLFAEERKELGRILSETRLRDPWKYTYYESSEYISFADAGFYNADQVCVCGNDREALEFADACAEKGTREFRLCFTPSYGRGLFAEEHRALKQMLSRTRLKDTRHSYNESSSYIFVSDAVWYGRGRVGVCASEEDAAAFLRTCREQRYAEFRICLTSDRVYASMTSDNAKAFFRLLKDAGGRDQSLFHSDDRRILIVEDAKW